MVQNYLEHLLGALTNGDKYADKYAEDVVDADHVALSRLLRRKHQLQLYQHQQREGGEQKAENIDGTLLLVCLLVIHITFLVSLSCVVSTQTLRAASTVNITSTCTPGHTFSRHGRMSP